MGGGAGEGGGGVRLVLGGHVGERSSQRFRCRRIRRVRTGTVMQLGLGRYVMKDAVVATWIWSGGDLGCAAEEISRRGGGGIGAGVSGLGGGAVRRGE